MAAGIDLRVDRIRRAKRAGFAEGRRGRRGLIVLFNTHAAETTQKPPLVPEQAGGGSRRFVGAGAAGAEQFGLVLDRAKVMFGGEFAGPILERAVVDLDHATAGTAD